jgi:cell division protein FtsB
MATSNVHSELGGAGKDAASVGTRDKRVVRRRRLFVLGGVLLMLLVIFWCNYGPLIRHAEAEKRYAAAAAKVADVQSKNAAMQSQVSQLNDPAYLQQLARQELSYALPNEKLYIVSGAGATTTTQAAAGASAGEGGQAGAGSQRSPGLLERILRGIGSIF